MVTSTLRTRDRYKHHRPDFDRTRESVTSLNSSSSKKRHYASLQAHSIAYGDEDTVISNTTNDSLSVSGSLSIESRSILHKSHKSDLNLYGQDKKMQSFRFHYLRKIQNVLSSPKIVLAIIAFLILLGIVILELTSSSGNYGESKEKLERFLNDSVGGIGKHPIKALSLYICLYIIVLLCLLPGTPLTVGGSFVFSKSFGVKASMISITSAVLISTTVAYVSAFFVGRYLLHSDAKQRMRRKYPMFEAFDKAISENAFRIISLLHLTPIIPFGPVSYMSGGLTSMPILSFTLANLASIPLLILYVFIGATAGQLFVNGKKENESAVTEEQQQSWMVLLGMCLSFISIALISYLVKKELKKVFDENEKESLESKDILDDLLYVEPDLQYDDLSARDVVNM